MFKFIKSLFGDTPEPAVVSKSSSAAAASELPLPPVSPPRPTPRPASLAPPGPSVDIPLTCVADRLNPALRSHLLRAPLPADIVKLPLATALEQLPRGAVRIPFRELRQAIPGMFRGAGELDESLVDVPLAEVLARVNPSHLARRREQKRVATPGDIPTVFGSRKGTAGLRSQPAVTDKASVLTSKDDLASSRVIGQAVAATEPVKPVLAAPVVPENRPVVPTPSPAARPAPAKAPAEAPAAADAEPVKVALVSLARNWPEPLRRDVMGSHLAASIHIPFSELQAAMKRGKAIFTWKQLRLWMTPKVSNALTEHDAASLELPLPVLAPLFIARLSNGDKARKVATAADIPDVFSSRKPEEQLTAPPPPPPPPLQLAPEPTAAPASLLDTMQVKVPAAALQPKAASAAAAAPSAAQTRPDKLTMARSSALPTEVVQQATHLSGVAGALVATPDGLVIANQLPPRLSAETVAAFLPQVFSRLGQYTRELRMGEPTQVEMLVENVPLQIFKTHSAYFAVLGKSTEPLPKPQLTALAAQLSARTK